MRNRDDFPLFCLVLARECPSLAPRQILDHATELRRMARALERLDVLACNTRLTEHQEKRAQRWRERLQAYVSAHLFTADAVLFNGDPRGYAVKLLLPSGAYNTMGGREEGWGVPT